MPALSPSLVGVDALLEASALFLGAPLPLTGFSIVVTLKESSQSCGVGAPFGHLVSPWYQDDAGPLAPHRQWHETARRQNSQRARARVASGQVRRTRTRHSAVPRGAPWQNPYRRRSQLARRLSRQPWSLSEGRLGTKGRLAGVSSF